MLTILRKAELVKDKEARLVVSGLNPGSAPLSASLLTDTPTGSSSRTQTKAAWMSALSNTVTLGFPTWENDFAVDDDAEHGPGGCQHHGDDEAAPHGSGQRLVGARRGGAQLPLHVVTVIVEVHALVTEVAPRLAHDGVNL